MKLTRENKKQIVSEVASVANSAIVAIAAEYRGLTVAQMTKLRMNARNSNVYLRVLRNTLARKALENTHFECMKKELKGPLILAFSNEDPGAPARLFRDFSKQNECLAVKMLSIGGVVHPAAKLEAMANLPTRDEAIAKLMYVFKAPIEKFVRTLAEPHAKLVRTIAAIRDQKQQESA